MRDWIKRIGERGIQNLETVNRQMEGAALKGLTAEAAAKYRERSNVRKDMVELSQALKEIRKTPAGEVFFEHLAAIRAHNLTDDESMLNIGRRDGQNRLIDLWLTLLELR